MYRKEPRLPSDLIQTDAEARTKTRAREDQQAELCRHIASSLPPDLEALIVSPYSAWADGFVEYSRKTRDAAAQLVRELPPEPCAFVKAGSCGMYPMRWVEAMSEEKRERSEVHDEILPVWWDKEGPHPFEGVARLCWYSRGCRDTSLFEVRVRIEEDPATLREEIRKDDRGRKVKSVWHRDRWPNGEWVNYSSGTVGKPGHSLAYFWREPGGGAPKLADYLAGGDAAYPPDGDGGYIGPVL